MKKNTILGMLIIMGLCSAANADQGFYDNTGDGLWQTASNWWSNASPNTLPGAGDNAVIKDGRTANIDNYAAVAYSVYVGSGVSSTLNLLSGGGTLTADGNLYVGAYTGGNGTMTVDGDMSIAGGLNLGFNSGVGTLTVNSGTSTFGGTLRIGNTGTSPNGILTINNGATVKSGSSTIAWTDSTTSTIALDLGGTLIFTGDASAAVGWGIGHDMIVATGSATGIEWDYDETTPGETTVQGALLLTGTQTFDDTTGDGLWQTAGNWGGTHGAQLPMLGDNAIIGTNWTAAIGNFSAVAYDVYVGSGVSSTLNLLSGGGTLTAAGTLFVGTYTGGNGTMTVDGDMNIAGGLNLGFNSGVGTLTVNSGTSTFGGTLRIGNTGTSPDGTLTINNGATVKTAVSTIAWTDDTTSTIALDLGGTLVFTGDASAAVNWGLGHGMIVATGNATEIEWDYNVTTSGETTVRGAVTYSEVQQGFYDNTADGLWQTAGNWWSSAYPNTLPAIADNAIIEVGRTANIDNYAAVAYSVYVGSGVSSTLNLLSGGGTLTVAGTLFVGAYTGGNGTMTVDGDMSIAGGLNLGFNSGVGTLTVNSGTSTFGGRLRIGNDGTSPDGTLTINNGATVKTAVSTIAWTDDTTSTIALDLGGTLVFTGDASVTVNWGLGHGMIVATGNADEIEWDYNVTTPGETTLRGVGFYSAWAVGYGLDPDGNGAWTEDPDDDGMENLLEYALGGDPTIDDAAAMLPTSIFPDASTWEYVYRRRLDAAARDLTYGLKLKINSLLGAWDYVGTDYETTSVVIDANFESVTNTIPITGIDAGFVTLEVAGD